MHSSCRHCPYHKLMTTGGGTGPTRIRTCYRCIRSLLASAVESVDFADADVGQWKMRPGTVLEEHDIYDADTAIWNMALTLVSEGKAFTESATAQFTFTGSATELHTSFEAATAPWVLTASALESHVIQDAGTATFTYTGSFAELILHDDSFQAAFAYTAGGSEVYIPAAETGTAVLDYDV